MANPLDGHYVNRATGCEVYLTVLKDNRLQISYTKINTLQFINPEGLEAYVENKYARIATCAQGF